MSADWLPPIPLVIPLLAAALVVAAAPLLNEKASGLIAIAAALATTCVCALLLARSGADTIVYWFGGWQPRDGVAVGISFTIDPLGAGMALLASTLVTAALIYAWSYFDAIGTLFHALMLVFLAAMVGYCLTGDLFNLFVFFELMSVAAYALTGYKVEETGPIQGALNFAVSNSIGAFMILYGIALLYARTGALNLAQIGRALNAGPVDGLVIVAFTLLGIGLLVKGAVVPFHFWLADAHAVAPTPVCVLFSGVMVELGLYGLVRVYWTVFATALAPHASGLQVVLIGAGALTAVIGGVMCYLQRHIKRLLAYSTVSHAGAFLIGAGTLSPLGLAGTALYVLGHGLVKGGLFMVAGILLDRYGTVDEIELTGRGRKAVPAGVVFGLGALALAGLPPFLTLLGKSLIEEAVPEWAARLVLLVLIVSSVLTGGALLRTTGRVFLGLGRQAHDAASRAPTHGEEQREGHAPEERGLPWGMLVPPAVLLMFALLMGVVETPLRHVESATLRLVDQPAYLTRVLDAQPLVLPESTESARASASGMTFGALSTVGALGLAVIALELWRLPHVLAAGARSTLEIFARPLRAIHSGHVGDYAAWLLIGAASFGAAYAAILR